MDVEDFIKLKKKLSNYKDLTKEELMKYLQPLENCEITKQILKQSMIHQVVSKLAKNKLNIVDSKVQKKAQRIKQRWKNVLQGKPIEQNQYNDYDKEEKQNEKSKQQDQGSKIIFQNVLREKFFNGFKKKFEQNLKEFDHDKVLQICLEIEKLLYAKAEENDIKYAKIAREKFQILSAKDNNNIVEKIYDSSLSIFNFVNSDAKTLLSNKKLEQIMQEGKQYTMQALQTDFYLKNSDVKEGEFQCFKCKGKKIMTTQKQMRSADEPMTTFFHCVQCNNRWKN